MRRQAMVLCLTVLAAPAWAKAPADIADLVGARAAGAETEIQARGYDNYRNNIWWNPATRACVRIHVSNGRYASIDTLKPSDCGQASASSGGSSGDVPQAALNACMRRADQYQNVATGTSMVSGAQRSGANWVLKMDSGEFKSTCTVTASGKVVSIDPGH